MAKIIDSDSTCDQPPGILSKIDKLCRRILPGYNYIRNRRSGSRDSLDARRVCSGFIIPAKFRGNRGKNSAVITDEIYAGAGISKSEFCKTLEELLRKKLIVMQERMKQVDLEEYSWEAHYNGNPSKQEEVEEDNFEDEESFGMRPLVSQEMRQRMIQAMIHESGQETTDMDTQETLDNPHSFNGMEQMKPSDDIQLKENQMEEEPEPDVDMDTESESERVPTPNSLLDFLLS